MFLNKHYVKYRSFFHKIIAVYWAKDFWYVASTVYE